VNLERNGFDHEQIMRIGRVHRIFYRDGLNRTQALEKLQASADLMASKEGQILAEFYANSQRSVA
jgi:UDP-N-acetylglucosamine acyltransferase